jgi:phosphoglycolate phosphatase
MPPYQGSGTVEPNLPEFLRSLVSLSFSPSRNFPLPVSAVAFDLDGTLVDTLPDLHEAANRMLGDLGRSHVDDSIVREYVGDGVDRLVKRLLTGDPDGEPDSVLFDRAGKVFRSYYAEVLSAASRPFPGVMEGLQEMRRQGLRLACITNKPVVFTEPLLRDMGLTPHLDLVLSGDSLLRKKPDPLPLEHCARVFGVPPSRLLMIGDSANDCRAARAAGCPVFCVPYGYRGRLGVHELDCDAIVPALLDSMKLIQISQS